MQNLNQNQKQGVTTTEGPVLILAGAGSGKTRVLTERVAYLMSEKGVAPWNIMAITFTNKAAGEMRERVSSIAGPGAESVWVATFHSSCVRILRAHAERLGYSSGFSIYDSDDSKSVMKEVLKRLNIDSKRFPERTFLARISSAKDTLQKPSDIPTVGRDPIESQLARVYKAYQERLLSQNAMDFDDLIFNTVELFRHSPEVLGYYQERFKYIMVDEYQDTNTAQFELVRLLADAHHNLCVVGDDDQSIYKFRGANILNILNFESHFPEAKVIKLEENYRSTTQILNAANAVIKNNRGRKEKALWTSNPDGEKINFKRVETSYEEAEFIARDIEKQLAGGLKYSDNAILYRTNMQSRALEERLLMSNIPYRIVGGTNFYQRKEVKDAIAYLKVVDNGRDDIACLRVINNPRRGIGDTTIERVMTYAARNNLSFYESLLQIENIADASKAAGKIKGFTDFIEGFKSTKTDTSVSVLLEEILRESGYTTMLELQDTDEAKGRLENLGELVTKAVTYEKEHPEDGSLTGFLEEVSLIADIDNLTGEEDRVLLMTLHSSKGLEFNNVYIAGMEDGLFPGMRTLSSGDDEEMEEERRLAYVGITRAKRRLTLTSALRRMVHGETQSHPISRFVSEIPADMIIADTGGERIQAETSRETSHYREPRGVSNAFRSHTASKPYAMKNDPAVSGVKIQKNELDYGPGDRVSHAKFGQGEVVSIRDGGRDYEVTVEFDTAGTKKMFASFARLAKI